MLNFKKESGHLVPLKVHYIIYERKIQGCHGKFRDIKVRIILTINMKELTSFQFQRLSAIESIAKFRQEYTAFPIP